MKTTNVILKFPSQFSKFVNNVTSVDFEGESVADFIDHLEEKYGDIKERILEDDGKVRPYINFFIGSKNISSLKGLETVVSSGDKISLLLSRAGG